MTATPPKAEKKSCSSRGMPIFSRSLVPAGECDIVEFRKSTDGITLHGRDGLYTVYPVEYKHGEPKDSDIEFFNWRRKQFVWKKC
jgi:CRISPR-associated exonuclease Cas4